MVRRGTGLWMLVLGMAMAQAVGWAADETPEVELGRVLVSVRRMPGLEMDQAAFPAHTTVITQEEIAQSGAVSVPELLRRQAGVTLQDARGFGLGADTGVNLRGIATGSRSNVLVLVDGIRQNRITGDEVHWQSIPISQIERIEILRGGAGMIYGEGALAGVINIVTSSGGERPLQTEERVEVGSYGWQQYVASAFGRQGPVRYATSYTRQFLDGYRDSTAARTTTITANAGVELTDRLRVRINTLHSQDTSHFAGGLAPQQTQANRRSPGAFNGFFDDDTTQVGVEQAWHAPAGFSTLLAGVWRERMNDSVTTGRFFSDADSRGLSLRLAHEAQGGRLGHTFITGVELGQDKATTGSRGSPSLSESNRTNIGLYAEETMTLLDRLTLVGGFRYDQLRFDEALTFPTFSGTLRFAGRSPKIGATLRVNDQLSVYANYARAFKAPNIDDLDAVLPPFTDSISARPQLADHVETGLRLRPRRWLQADVTWFSAVIKRELLFNPFTFATDNFNTRRAGIEVSLTGELVRPSLSYYLNGSVIRARFTKGPFTGYVIPGTPEYQLNAGLTYELLRGLRVGLDWQLVSTQFRINDLFNQFPADNYGVLNVTARYDQSWYSMYLTINNITNEEYGTFQSSAGTAIGTGENPAPPTNWVAGVALRF